MRITIVEARKLLEELKKKFPGKDCFVSIDFQTWNKEHISVYVSNSHLSCTRQHKSADDVRQYYNL